MRAIFGVKTTVFWDVAMWCRSCVNRCFGRTSVHTRSTQCHIPGDGILHSHLRENLKSCVIFDVLKIILHRLHNDYASVHIAAKHLKSQSCSTFSKKISKLILHLVCGGMLNWNIFVHSEKELTVRSCSVISSTSAVTHWSRGLLEKLTVAELVKEIPYCVLNLKYRPVYNTPVNGPCSEPDKSSPPSHMLRTWHF
jgi:hypothetical protein